MLPSSCLLMAIVILGNGRILDFIVGLAAGLFLYTIYRVWSGHRKIHKALESLSPEITKAVISECNVTPQESVHLKYDGTS